MLVGKVIDRPLFGNEIDKRDKESRWLSSIFTLKLKHRYIQELPPQIVKDLKEPVYQAKFMHNWKDLGLKTEYLVVTTRVSSIFIMEFFDDKWTVVNSLNNIHS